MNDPIRSKLKCNSKSLCIHDPSLLHDNLHRRSFYSSVILFDEVKDNLLALSQCADVAPFFMNFSEFFKFKHLQS